MLPTLFISHGAPTLAIEPSPAREALARLGAELPRPRAVLVASAHWTTAAPAIDVSARPPTIHDFGGFGPELEAMRYPCPGAPEVAARARDLIAGAGIACATVERGLDHGAWVPLSLLYPRADVPVASLAIQPRLGAEHHLRLGRALAALRGEDVLVIGSGSITHNLAELAPGVDRAPEWVAAFADWALATIEAGDEAALAAWRTRAPHAARNHPSDEHLLPLHVAFAAAGPGARGRALHRSVQFGALAMDAYAFG